MPNEVSVTKSMLQQRHLLLEYPGMMLVLSGNIFALKT